MDTIQIEALHKGHIPGMAVLERDNFSEPWTEDQLAYELDNPHAVYFCAVSGGKTVGFAGMHNIVGEGYITNVAVDESCRRRGIAQSLLEHLCAYAEENRMEFITLEVRVSNAGAIALYKKMGFLPQGERRRFYTSPVEDALLMTRFFNGEGTGKEC